MRITVIAFPVLRLQYRIARAPLELFDKHFVSRIDSRRQARLLYERSVGTLDTAVGNVLRDPKLRLRGTALVERSAALAHAAALDAVAARREKRADDELHRKRGRKAAAKDQAHATKRRGVRHTPNKCRAAQTGGVREFGRAHRCIPKTVLISCKRLGHIGSGSQERRVEADQGGR